MRVVAEIEEYQFIITTVSRAGGVPPHFSPLLVSRYREDRFAVCIDQGYEQSQHSCPLERRGNEAGKNEMGLRARWTFSSSWQEFGRSSSSRANPSRLDLASG